MGSNATDYFRSFCSFLFCVDVRSQSSNGLIGWELDLECLSQIFFYDSFSLGYCNRKEKFSTAFKGHEGEPESMASMEFYRFRVVLCSNMFLSKLCTWLANCRNVANHDYFRLFTGTAFLYNSTNGKWTDKKRGQIPFKGLILSLIILLGVVLMQVEQANQISTKDFLLGVVPVIMASFAYPLGNRKMMDVCKGRLDTYQRVLGMTLASLPFWFTLSLYGLFTDGLPSQDQTIQSGLVAICSGVIATVFFFHATDLVRGNMRKLASVEATQSVSVLFTLWGEIVFLAAPIPSAIAWIGIAVLMSGMILHSYVSQMKKFSQNQKESA